jgi:hypothetical protein
MPARRLECGRQERRRKNPEENNRIDRVYIQRIDAQKDGEECGRMGSREVKGLKGFSWSSEEASRKRDTSRLGGRGAVDGEEGGVS